MCSDPVRKESVWDYPLPPRLERIHRHLKVIVAGRIVAETRQGYRVLESSHPPTYYFPPQHVNREFLIPSRLHTFSKFKGQASYFDLYVGDRLAENAAWYYPNPAVPFLSIQNYVAFYPGRVDACFIDDEQVRSNRSDYY